jgi:hypothetical protein
MLPLLSTLGPRSIMTPSYLTVKSNLPSTKLLGRCRPRRTRVRDSGFEGRRPWPGLECMQDIRGLLNW